MNKFCMLSISWILLRPCFVDDVESSQISYQYRKEEINHLLAVDPKLLKALEEDISLLAQKKNRKSSDSIQESLESDDAFQSVDTPVPPFKNSISEEETVKPAIQAASEANQKTIADVSNAPAAGVALGLNPQLLEDHVVKIPKGEQQIAVAEKNNSSRNQTNTNDLQAPKKKEVRKKRPISRDERRVSQKKKISERLFTRKKKYQSPRQDKRLVEREKKESPVSKNRPAANPSPKNPQNVAKPQKLPPNSAAKETAPREGQTSKQLPKFSQPESPQSLNESKKLAPAAKEAAPREGQTSKQLPKFSKPGSSPNLAEVKKDPPKPEVKEKIEEKKQTPKFPKSLGPQNSVTSKRTPSDRLPSPEPLAKEKPYIEEQKLAEITAKDQERASEITSEGAPEQQSASENHAEEQIAPRAYNPDERKGRFFVPSTRKEASLAPNKQVPLELSEKNPSKSQTDSQDQNINEKEALGSIPLQQQLNSKETSSTYDRYIPRQNHNTLSEDSPQNNSPAEQNVGTKSNTGVVFQPPAQKKIESEQLAPGKSVQAAMVQKEEEKNAKADQPTLSESAQNDLGLKPLDFIENLQAQREEIDSGQLEAQGISQSDTQDLSEAHSHPLHLKKCQTPFHMAHIGLRHREARGIGYRDGYTTLEGFAIYNRTTSFMPFIDLRGHVFNNGKFAGNAGLGGRSFFPSIDHVLGCYLYYDVRQDRHRLTAQQLGPGIELLSKRMEYRLNGYFPVGARKSDKYDFGFGAFDGNHILLKAKQRQVMTGMDAEIGAHLTQSTKYDLYAGAGPYYFSSSHASSWGGKVRLLGRFKEYISLEASYSYDRLFKSVVQGSIAIRFPFGKKLRRQGEDCSSGINLALSRAAFAPQRFEIPVIKRVSRKLTAINPATGRPWKVWFVNNTSSSNGTFESPFPTLVQAQNASGPNDMIYVFPGDGTTRGMNMGITLQNGQTFFGSGIAHLIRTTNGRIKIPAFSSSSPLITNTGGNVVTLANGNAVSGFNIFATHAGSTVISGSNINGTKIENNSIFGNVSFEGIFIGGAGNVDVKNNQVISSVHSLTGIGLTVLNGMFMKANISNNIVSGFIDTIDFAPQANSTTAQANATIENNSLSNFMNDGIFYPTGMSNSIVRIIGNVINNTIGVGGGSTGGISVTVNNHPNAGSVLIQNNIVTTTSSNPNVNSILVEIGQPTGSSLNADINNNIVTTGSGAGSIGLNIFSTVNNTLCTSIVNNRITQQASSGTHDISITTSGNGIVNIDDFSGNIGQNIQINGNVNIVPEGTCGN
jgi:hypothetical protein